jgi:glutamate synthase domain-containing protein 2/rubredoxin
VTFYRCNICNVFEYNPKRGDSVSGIKPGTDPGEFPEDWRCPICHSNRTHLKEIETHRQPSQTRQIFTCPVCGAKSEISLTEITGPEKSGYLEKWERKTDNIERDMELIHRISASGEPVSEPMRTKKSVLSWEDIIIAGAQLAKIPLNKDDDVKTKTVIGPNAKYPLIIETPVYITHMSFGALSREMKIALAKGSAAVKTAIGSGEGGILGEEQKGSYRYIFEYVPNRYSVSMENLRAADAIEIKIGQSTKPGLGGELPAEKVTEEIAAIRGFPQGTDIISPASFGDIRNRDDLREKVDWLRETSGGRPIGIKIAAGNIEADMEVAVYANPDFITIDGRPGGTGAADVIIKDATSVPTIFALHRARRYLDENGRGDISLVITGGLRLASDFAKAIAMGADAVAIGTAALMAAACQQYRVCNTGECPVGVTTQNPDLRKRLKIDISAKKLENFLKVSTEELKDFARLTGNDDIHDLSIEDLYTTSSEISGNTFIRHV